MHVTQRGELFGESPQACPFIALELDRDRRSDRPDYRHRCFAEPTPQPRAIAHQEQYCLSPDFAACPIFQGWAMRAAAKPVPVPQGYEGRARSTDPSSTPTPAGAQPPAPNQPSLPDVPPIAPQPGETWPKDTFAPAADAGAPSQLRAFEAPSGTKPAASPRFADSEPDFAPPAPTVASVWASSPGVPESTDEPPVPGFLSGRSERPATQRPRASRATPSAPSASPKDAPYKETVGREDLVPSWELTRKYGADVTDHHRRDDVGDGGGVSGGGDRFGGIVTAIAVIAILALGVAGVIFLPGLLAGKAPTASPSPTFVAGVPTDSGLASLPFPTSTLVTPAPTPVITPVPTPEATAHTYKVKSGDTLGKIARKFGVSVDDIRAVNPQITNPDDIFVGEVITIPQPAATEAPSATP